MGASEMNEDEHELLARLQAQFGDMDVGGMLQGSAGNNAEGEKCIGDVSSESSLEEPTAEELRAWQEAQYEKGKMKLEAKKIMESSSNVNVHKSALQRRRQKKTAGERALMREYEKNEEAQEWEHLSPAGDLGGATSVFFPTNLEGVGGPADANFELVGGVNPLFQKLVEGDPEVLGTEWAHLYSSSEGDGLSFRNLCDKIRGYDGPTVILFGGTPSPKRSVGQINQDDRVSLGFFTTDSWIESPEYFGSDDDCFLFSLNQGENDVKIFRPKARSQSTPNNLGTKRYMYCHPSSLATTNGQTNGSLHGIGIGGTASQPRLHITETLEECRALGYDKLFDDGDLLSGKCSQSLYYFDVDCMEVWGVGGKEWIADALEAQAKAREMHAASLEKARKVDKSQFLEDFENGLTCGTKPGLFSHRGLVEERCDF